MTNTSREIFFRHFSTSSLQEIIESHLKDGVARGVDGTSYDRFLETRDAEVQLINRRALTGAYRFSPFRQKLILKNATSSPRQVSIPTLRDRVTLRALNNFLSEVFNDCRPQHSHPVISAALRSVDGMQEDECFVKLDIQSFYDAVNHEALMKNLRARIRNPLPLQLIHSALVTPTGATVSDAAVNELGIPQGLSISNILSSIYLRSIDERYSSMLGLSYHRYVDDILCIVPVNEAEYIAKDIAWRLRREKKLSCHPLGTGKSMVCEPGSSVLYLGYAISKSKITVRASSEKKLMSSIMEIIFGASSETRARALWRVNLRITGCKFFDGNVGWMFYFSQIDDKTLLAKMDAQVRAAVIKKFGSGAELEVKTLIKAYHQVKYNHRNSKYLPNFDIYTREQMIAHLETLAPGKYRHLENNTDQQISRIFRSSVWREVKRMERDTLGSFS